MSISQEMDSPPAEKPRVITVRCSAELHERVKRAAWLRRKSMNEFCIELLTASLANSEKNHE